MYERIKATVGSLSLRLRGQAGAKSDLAPAVRIVPDLVRAVANARNGQIAQVRALVASLSDVVAEDEPALASPDLALGDIAARRSYLAGALWTLNLMASAKMDAFEQTATPSVQRRRAIQDVVRELLRDSPSLTPGQVLAVERCQALGIRSDEVSKALGELLRHDIIRQTEAPRHADRRSTFYAMGPAWPGSTAEGEQQAQQAEATSAQLAV